MLKTSKVSEAFEDAGKIAVETTINIRTVASLTKEKVFLKKFSVAVERTHK